MKRLSLCFLISLLMIGTLVGCGGTSSGRSSLTPAEIVAADKAMLAVGYATGDASSSVTQNVTPPTAGTNGSTIAWNSSNPAVISSAGAVSCPLTGGAVVTLTATITTSARVTPKTSPSRSNHR